MTRRIEIGPVPVGGGAPISVQTMTKTDTRDITATISQIKELTALKCDLIRLAVLNEEAALALQKIKSQVTVPLIADIHFDYKLALLAIQSGVDGLRINPGNIGSREGVHAVVSAAAEKGIPIRIGVNIGSLAPEIAEKYGHTPRALVESALTHVDILEEEHFQQIKISVKTSDVLTTIEAYKMLSERVDYPLHLGVTEAGGPQTGVIKSAIGIGTLLAEGIGDTIRVSLTGPPQGEVLVGRQILRSLRLLSGGIDLISCPTCGRCQIHLVEIARSIESRLPQTEIPLRVAVMGCPVNGPGEARDADVGIAGGKGFGWLFKKGEMIRKVPEDQLVDTLMLEIDHLLQERNA